MRVPGLVEDEEEDQLKTSPNLMEILRKDAPKRKEITKERKYWPATQPYPRHRSDK